MKISKKNLIDQLRQQRKQLAREKNWGGVLVILNRLLEIDPNSKRFCAKANMLSKWGCILEAKENYEEALMLNPHSEKAQKGIAQTTIKLRNLEKVFSQEMQKNYQEFMDSENIPHLRSEVINSILQKKWQTAAILCKKLSEIESTPLRFCMEAAMLLQNKKWKEAIISYDKALQKNPQFEIALLGIARIKEVLEEEKKYNLKVIDLGPETEDQFKQTFDDSMYLGVADNVSKPEEESSGEIIL